MSWTPPPYTPGVVWEDLPDVATPLDTTNLNQAQNAIVAHAEDVGRSVVNYFGGSSVQVVREVGNLGPAYTFDLGSLANQNLLLTGTLNANCTMTFANRAANCRILLLLSQDATGGWTFAVSDGSTSQSVAVNSAANSLTALDVFCPDATNVYVAGVTKALTGGGQQLEPGNLGTSYTVDFGSIPNSTIMLVGTLNANCTITLANRAAGCRALMFLTQDGTGGRTLAISDGSTSQSVSINPTAGTFTPVEADCPDSVNVYLSMLVGSVNAELTSNKDQANGYAGLDSSGLLKLAELPSTVGRTNVQGTGFPWVINVMDAAYGAKGNALSTRVDQNGTNQVTITAGGYPTIPTSYVGKYIVGTNIPNATTVTGISGSTLTLSNATTGGTVTGIYVWIGTEDTAAINAAFAVMQNTNWTANALGRGATLYFPPGRYLVGVNQALVYTLISGSELLGAGSGHTIQNSAGATTKILSYEPASVLLNAGQASNVGLFFQNTNQSAGWATEFNAMRRLGVKNLTASGIGIKLDSLGFAMAEYQWEDVLVYGGDKGWYLTDSSNNGNGPWNVRWKRCEAGDNNGQKPNYAIYGDSGTTYGVSSKIDECRFVGTGFNGVFLTGGTGVGLTVTDTTIESCGSEAICARMTDGRVSIVRGHVEQNFTNAWFNASSGRYERSQGGSLSGTLSTGGGAITTLPVNALTQGFDIGSCITLNDGSGHKQTWTVTSTVAAGVTSVPVASQTPSFNFPSGTTTVQDNTAASMFQIGANNSNSPIFCEIDGADANLVDGAFSTDGIHVLGLISQGSGKLSVKAATAGSSRTVGTHQQPMVWCDGNIVWATIDSLYPNRNYSGNGADIGGSANWIRHGVGWNRADDRGALHLGVGKSGSGPRMWSGTGAPSAASFTAAAGDFYLRTDTPTVASQQLYICTVAGTPGTWINVGGAADDVQVFSASGTWTKPSGNPQVTRVLAFGAGGPGGSGRRDAAGTVRCAGGGGGSGGITDRVVATALLGATESVTVAGITAGAAGVTTDSTNGNTVSSPGAVWLGSSVDRYDLWANSGTSGSGGTSSTGSAGVGGAGSTGNGLSGGAASGTGGVGGNGTNNASLAAGSGASGGGLSSSNVVGTGGTGGHGGNRSGALSGGGSAGGVGAAGGNGTSPGTNGWIGGGGGGGGGADNGAGGGNGGNGAFPGGGGGGGGASVNGNVSGAGGSGAGGLLIAITSY